MADEQRIVPFDFADTFFTSFPKHLENFLTAQLGMMEKNEVYTFDSINQQNMMNLDLKGLWILQFFSPDSYVSANNNKNHSHPQSSSTKHVAEDSKNLLRGIRNICCLTLSRDIEEFFESNRARANFTESSGLMVLNSTFLDSPNNPISPGTMIYELLPHAKECVDETYEKRLQMYTQESANWKNLTANEKRKKRKRGEDPQMNGPPAKQVGTLLYMLTTCKNDQNKILFFVDDHYTKKSNITSDDVNEASLTKTQSTRLKLERENRADYKSYVLVAECRRMRIKDLFTGEVIWNIPASEMGVARQLFPKDQLRHQLYQTHVKFITKLFLRHRDIYKQQLEFLLFFRNQSKLLYMNKYVEQKIENTCKNFIYIQRMLAAFLKHTTEICANEIPIRSVKSIGLLQYYKITKDSTRELFRVFNNEIFKFLLYKFAKHRAGHLIREYEVTKGLAELSLEKLSTNSLLLTKLLPVHQFDSVNILEFLNKIQHSPQNILPLVMSSEHESRLYRMAKYCAGLLKSGQFSTRNYGLLSKEYNDQLDQATIATTSNIVEEDE